MVWIFLSLGALIVAVLSAYAGRLLWLLKKQNQAQKAAELHQQQAHQAQLKQYNQKLWVSMETIAKATQAGQCELSEAAIRLCVLLERLYLEPEQDLAKKFPALHGLYRAIAHHPTHDARKQYSKKEIRKLDKERLEQEQEFEAAITQELQQLLDWQTEIFS